jgi:hypothetical protein
MNGLENCQVIASTSLLVQVRGEPLQGQDQLGVLADGLVEVLHQEALARVELLAQVDPDVPDPLLEPGGRSGGGEDERAHEDAEEPVLGHGQPRRPGVDAVPGDERENQGLDAGQNLADGLGLLDCLGHGRAPNDLHDVEALHSPEDVRRAARGQQRDGQDEAHPDAASRRHRRTSSVGSGGVRRQSPPARVVRPR